MPTPRYSCSDWGKTGYSCKRFFFCCFRKVSSDHLLKNDPSLHIIDTVNQGASYPDPIKNIKTKIKGFKFTRIKRKTSSSGIFKE